MAILSLFCFYAQIWAERKVFLVGLVPVRSEEREAPDTAMLQYALLNIVPAPARESMTGEIISSWP